MSKLSLSLIIWGMLVLQVSARHGETPVQCEERYGAAITNLLGNTDVEQVAIYKKDALNIIVVFIKGIDNKVTADLIFYTRAQPYDPLFYRVPAMSEEDEATILATVKGQWEKYKPAQQLAGPKYVGGSSTVTGQKVIGTKPTVKTMSSGPGIYAATSEKVAKAVQDVLQLVYPRELPPTAAHGRSRRLRESEVTKELSCTVVPISHNGLHLYAFRTIQGVAICSDGNISRMTKWVEFIRGKNAAPAPKPLTGL